MTTNVDLYKNIIENMVPLHQFLGFKVVEIKEGWAKMMIPFRPELVGDPRSKRWHGGMISTLMDSVGGAAGITTLTSYEDKLATIDIRVDYLRGTKPEDLFAEAEIILNGNRIIVTRMKAYHIDEKIIVAEGKAVYNVRRKEQY